jgi:hypothetical protein
MRHCSGAAYLDAGNGNFEQMIEIGTVTHALRHDCVTNHTALAQHMA